MIRTRFAPSPNGALHLGHAYAAIVAHDLARRGSGEFLLRIEDIDGPRSRPEFVCEFLADLEWLGLPWDNDVSFQSRRFADYEDAAERLKAMDVLYPCTCTRAEIAAAATAAGPEGPIYPGTCREKNRDPGGAAWRLDVSKALAFTGPLEWTDEIAGVRNARPDLLGDVVLVRKELPASYHLAATLDDAKDGITVVTRGQDLFTATHVHRLLQELLGLPVPVWHHHPLLVEPDGRKLAKRRGSPSLADRRRAGEDGRAIADDLRLGRFPAGISLSSA
ncbi:tRNA glutamyl-Q(34) synthetase GluQRS [Novosphingobium marinum]|uniref:Glutamyl-Q tRNA(Asp) synthetase n=1 Tax=Novosphingobium marinum TaxID=1514948 RepID=A0A7Z0BU73_9SPHN|nr:tRNA glutamyl-Q(34) synthetase GluQRS [Novosphingobium marinum]NYH95929.1 glutamyl-Q tRNA(Asp) synthetase [Novosphingobium marinum]GGC31087.1 tRNA glutamyl-Q(34) synthetase GluQRS [Novosphingobium marinum]